MTAQMQSFATGPLGPFPAFLLVLALVLSLLGVVAHGAFA
jgi:hypothetical protein